MMTKRKLVLAILAAAALGAGSVTAQPYGPGYGMGPGMMGGGYGPGYGMGPGMMGPGMMGGYGYGYGIDLSAEQRAKMDEIQRDLQQQHWDLMGKLHRQGGPMYEAFGAGAVDEKKARAAYDAMAEAHKQMFESQLQARKRMEEVLTPEQRDRLRRGYGPRR